MAMRAPQNVQRRQRPENIRITQRQPCLQISTKSTMMNYDQSRYLRRIKFDTGARPKVPTLEGRIKNCTWKCFSAYPTATKADADSKSSVVCEEGSHAYHGGEIPAKPKDQRINQKISLSIYKTHIAPNPKPVTRP